MALVKGIIHPKMNILYHIRVIPNQRYFKEFFNLMKVKDIQINFN